MFTVVIAVSADEKKAERNNNNSNTINCMASPESNDKFTPSFYENYAQAFMHCIGNNIPYFGKYCKYGRGGLLYNKYNLVYDLQRIIKMG
ncbi:MAG: hypothetical protein HFH10_12035 [Dorea sp.]|nr:hypothetical protein [Dorea sp.]